MLMCCQAELLIEDFVIKLSFDFEDPAQKLLFKGID